MAGKRLAFLAMAAGVIVLVSQWGAVSDRTEALLRQERPRRQKVVYWTSSGSPEVDLKRARQFMDLHPDIQVQPNFRETGGLEDIIFVSFLSGNPPDRIDASVGKIRQMVVTGMVRPMDDLLGEQLRRDGGFLDRHLLGKGQLYRFAANPDDRFIRHMDQYPHEAARLLKMNGRLVGFRDVEALRTLTYNKRIFRAAAKMFPDAGLLDEHGEPVPPATWMEFHETARVLSEYGRRVATQRGLDKPVCYGLVIQGQRARDLMRGILPLAARAGSVGFNFKGGKWLADMPGAGLDRWRDRSVGCFQYEQPGFLAAFALLRKLLDDGCILPGSESRFYEDVRTELALGNAGMLLDGWHAALIGAERVPWAAQDLGSAPVPAPYRDAGEKARLEKLLGLDRLGLEVPPPNKLPRTVGATINVISSPARHPQAVWKWMHFHQVNPEVIKAECRRGTVPQLRIVRDRLDDPEWFPYPYQRQVYEVIDGQCVMWPSAPEHGPVRVPLNSEVFRKWFYRREVKDLGEIVRRARGELEAFSRAANEDLARRIADGEVRPEFWTFEDFSPDRGEVFFQRQQEAYQQKSLKTELADASARLEKLHPGLLGRTTYRYEPPETAWQALWVPGLMAAAVLGWLAWAAGRDVLRGRRPLAGTLAEARRGWHAYAFVLPGLAALFAFTMYPAAYQLYLALHKGTGLAPLQYVGLDNFRRILDVSDTHFDLPFWRHVLPNTALYMLFTTFASIAVALLFASLLNMPLRANRFYRVLFFIPLVTSLAVVSVIFIGLLAGTDSGLNQLLHEAKLDSLPCWLGLAEHPGERINWLGGTAGPTWLRTDLLMVMLVGTWHGLPYNIILLLAGLQSIDPQLYEAAKVDGAAAWKRFRHVTVPEMLPILIIIVFNALINAARAFGVAYVLTEGGTERSSELVATYIFKWGFTSPEGMEADLGYASALSIVYAALLGVLAFANVYIIARRWKRRLRMEQQAAGAPSP